MTRVEPWIIDIMNRCGGGPAHNQLEIGKRFYYEDDSTTRCLIEITGGQYMGASGICNNWTWRCVDEETDKLVGAERYGYNNGQHRRRFIPIEEQADIGRGI